jgi:uncharacterized protein (TIGR03435 family)
MLPVLVCLLLGSLAQFEVASIKPSSAEEGHSSWNSRHGNLDMRNMSLKAIILAAYGIKDYQYSGPDWLEKERFDISAKAPGIVEDDQMLLAMQALLVERFHLAVHRESKPTAAYVLVVAKGGPKLHEVKPGPKSSNNSQRGSDGITHLTSQRVSMERLAAMLMRFADRPVVDRTGLTGVYDFKLDWAGDEKADTTAPSLFTALQEQLGLKLQPDKIPVEFLVVDRCDKLPTEN